jgi:hypothetical protein
MIDLEKAKRHGCPQEDTPPAFRFQHPENPPQILPLRRKLLADLSRCARESLKVFLQDAVPETDPITGTVIAMQTFGDIIGHNPDCHILMTDGCF